MGPLMINMAFMPLYMWETWDVTPVTHEHTNGQWESRAVFSLSWIRNFWRGVLLPNLNASELHFAWSFQGYPTRPYLARPKRSAKYCIWQYSAVSGIFGAFCVHPFLQFRKLIKFKWQNRFHMTIFYSMRIIFCWLTTKNTYRNEKSMSIWKRSGNLKLIFSGKNIQVDHRSNPRNIQGQTVTLSFR